MNIQESYSKNNLKNFVNLMPLFHALISVHGDKYIEIPLHRLQFPTRKIRSANLCIYLRTCSSECNNICMQVLECGKGSCTTYVSHTDSRTTRRTQVIGRTWFALRSTFTVIFQYQTWWPAQMNNRSIKNFHFPACTLAKKLRTRMKLVLNNYIELF